MLAVGRERRVTGRGEGCVPGVTVTMAVCLGTTGWAAGGRGEGAGPEHEGPECPGRRGLRPAETGGGGCRLVWEGAGRLVGRSRGGSEGSAAWPAVSGAGGVRQEEAHSGWRSLTLRAVGGTSRSGERKGESPRGWGLGPPSRRGHADQLARHPVSQCVTCPITGSVSGGRWDPDQRSRRLSPSVTQKTQAPGAGSLHARGHWVCAGHSCPGVGSAWPASIAGLALPRRPVWHLQSCPPSCLLSHHVFRGLDHCSGPQLAPGVSLHH